MGTADYDWLSHDYYDGGSVLEELFPNLKFEYIDVNGADDVLSSKKWTWPTDPTWPTNRRMICILRPGSSEAVRQGMQEAHVDPNHGLFILGPELRDVSSTAARDAVTSR